VGSVALGGVARKGEVPQERGILRRRGHEQLLSLASERYTVGADGSVEVYVYGAVSATTETSVSVTAGDGAVVSCSVPAGTDLSKFPVGTNVKMHCHRIGGEFRLEYLKSEHAVIEIGR
jgi:hypothetical protein